MIDDVYDEMMSKVWVGKALFSYVFLKNDSGVMK